MSTNTLSEIFNVVSVSFVWIVSSSTFLVVSGINQRAAISVGPVELLGCASLCRWGSGTDLKGVCARQLMFTWCTRSCPRDQMRPGMALEVAD